MQWRQVNLSSYLQDKSKNKIGILVFICSSDKLSNDVKFKGGNADVISHFPVQQDDGDGVTPQMNLGPVWLRDVKILKMRLSTFKVLNID